MMLRSSRGFGLLVWRNAYDDDMRALSLILFLAFGGMAKHSFLCVLLPVR